MKTKKLEVKDLIHIGLFSVLIIILTMLGGMIGFIPTLMPLVGFVLGIITGPVYMVYGMKIKKPGMLLIQQVILMLGFVAMGHGIYSLLTAFIGGILGELCLKKGNYQSVKWMRYAFVLASLSGVGNWIPVYFMRDSYITYLIESGYGEQFAMQMMSVLPSWSFPLVILLSMVGMYIGCTFGILMLKKHFVKAGMV